MSAGLPVIAYDCIAGPSDLVENEKTGFLIPLYNKELFKKQLREMLLNENLRESMGNKAKQIIRQFSVESIGEKFKMVLTSDQVRK